MGLIRRLFDRCVQKGGPLPEPNPWQQRPSIYEHLRDRPRADGTGIDGRPPDLPDEEKIRERNGLPWAAGAMDGVFSHHSGSDPGEGDVEALTAAVLAYGQSGSDADKRRVYDRVLDKGALGLVDAFLQALREAKGVRLDRLHALARSFATEAPDREPVKFGIALLGAFRQPEDAEIFRVLGRHDEFTLFAAVALANTMDGPVQELWALARDVEGWGRIHLVERLSGTQAPDIREWMLREGYRNSVMTEYLAHTCAVTGRLREALERSDPDDGLLEAAADLLEALVVGGPAKGMDDYAEGAEAAGRYLRHLEPREAGLRHLLAVETIRGFLEEADADWTNWNLVPGLRPPEPLQNVRGRTGHHVNGIFPLPQHQRRSGVEDSYLDLFNRLDAGASDLVTLRRLQAVGIRHVLFDPNVNSIEADVGGSLHRKANRFVVFANRNLVLRCQDPRSGIALLEVPCPGQPSN